MKGRMKISVLVFAVIAMASCKRAEPETFVLPEHFLGEVNIIFNQKNGSPAKYKEGRRIYEIPNSGVLLTQFDINEGFIDTKYYFIKNDSTLSEIKKLPRDSNLNKKHEAPKEIYVYNDGIAGSYGKELRYLEFIISDSKRLDSFYSAVCRDAFILKVDSILKEFSGNRYYKR